MLCAGRHFPNQKLVVPEESLSGSRTANSKRQILLLCKSVGLAVPHQEAPSLRNVSFKLLWLQVWQSCPAPEMRPLATFLQGILAPILVMLAEPLF